jgi:beta-N-acetylhexosaminidase
MGTLNAFEHKEQAVLAGQILKIGIPTIMLALRLPYDLIAFPQAPTYLCTYGLLEPSLRAAAKCLFGQAEIPGRLPVSIPGLYKAGFHFKR